MFELKYNGHILKNYRNFSEKENFYLIGRKMSCRIVISYLQGDDVDRFIAKADNALGRMTDILQDVVSGKYFIATRIGLQLFNPFSIKLNYLVL